ncbi:MAG: Dabb family protein [Janthinobacterium lividum]
MSAAGPITHVVLIQWTRGTTDTDVERIRAIARGLPARIPGILDLVEGPSVSSEGLEQGLQYGLVITFADAGSRDGYLPHPSHQVLVDELGRAAAHVAVFDVAGAQ